MAYGSLIESESIRDLTIRRVDLPLERPVETASGVLRTAALVLVDVRVADGVFGHAYLRTYTPVALRALATLLEDVAPLVTGESRIPWRSARACSASSSCSGRRGSRVR